MSAFDKRYEVPSRNYFSMFEFTSHCWQQALSYKKERPELFFAYLANKYGIYYGILTTNDSWQPTSGTPYPPKTAKFWI